MVLGEHTFGLFHNDSAGEGGLELFVEDLAAADRPFLQDADGGHVGQGLPECQIGLRERADLLCGTLDAGPTAEGGYRVRLRIPLSTD